MKAMRYHEFGGVENLREDEVPVPRPAVGEVLVDVAAASVNPIDWKIGAGYLRGILEYPLPFVPGADFSGVIRSVGIGVTGLLPGDRVFGATPLDRMGTFAETIAVPASVIAKAPKSISLSTAAAVPLAALTAWFATLSPEHANVQRGQSVLIHGGAGGTGVFAVQFALWRGARVLATASGENAEFLRSLGVQEAIDYRATRFEDVVREVDAVVDLVGGDVQGRSFPLIRKGGVMASIVSPPDQHLARQRGVRATLLAPGPPRDAAVLTQVAKLIDEETVKVVVSGKFPLAEAAKALARSRDGHVRAKLLLVIGEG